MHARKRSRSSVTLSGFFQKSEELSKLTQQKQRELDKTCACLTGYEPDEPGDGTVIVCRVPRFRSLPCLLEAARTARDVLLHPIWITLKLHAADMTRLARRSQTLTRTIQSAKLPHLNNNLHSC